MNYDYSSGYQTVPNISDDAAKGLAFLGMGIFAFVLLFVVAIYVYYAVCLMKIAKKTGTANGWFAWIPILNLILMIQCAKKPMWWIIMFFIPLVNIIFSILLWMGIAEAVKKPSWVGVLTIIPVVNIIIIGYLAFSKMEEAPVSTPVSPIQPPIQPAA